MASTLNETIREDGLRVITKKLSYTKKINLSVSALVGTAYDGEKREGFYHFFEHMAFKGTKTRGMDTIKELLGRFNNKNAFTNYLHTTYLLEGVYLVKDLMWDILFDIYVNPAYPEPEINKEKGVVLREAAQWKDNDGRYADGELCKLLWRTNPIRQQGVGTLQGLTYVNQNSLLEAHKEWYRPSNTVVVGVGKIDHSWLVDEAFKFFPVDSGVTQRVVWNDEAGELPIVREALFERKERENAVAVIGCKMPDLPVRENRAMSLLTSMLGGGFDSVLFKEIRDKLGFSYSTGAGYDLNPLASSFSAFAEVGAENAERARDLLYDLVLNYPLEPAHFERAKTFITENLLISLETPHSWELLIWRKIINEGQKLSVLENFIGKAVKMVSDIKFEESLELRKKFLLSERFASVIVKPC